MPTEEPAPVEAAPAPAPAAAVEKVMLGSPELTAGIPGDGALTTEQIETWLADPKNHATLEVELPLGLSAGAGQIVIPADNPMTRAKIELGRQLYFDKRLSADSTVSCADCHHPDEGYARHTQFGVGIGGQEGGRNSPVSFNRILSGAQFWDGRAASLEEQAVGPIANPIEMGNTHEAAVDTVKKIEGYRLQFAKVFEDGVTIDNIGKAIATFERAIVTGPSPFDYYEPVHAMQVAFKDDLEDLEALKDDDPDLYEDYMAKLKTSEEHPMSESAKRGREVFFTAKGSCTACHVGANLADEKYHNLGIGMDQEEPDLGRFAVTKDDKDRGAFKTPTVRNIGLTAPYMHDGSLKTLEEIVEWYAKGGHPNPHLSKDIKKLELSDQDKKDLVEFMKACTGDFPKVEQGRLPA
ncbi:MAG: c-type cytochrome [Planctomycetaceae bacterium]|nr:c-type cytochrome [Planctomycetaceae bacterium]